jgi:hypothetical protein
MSKSEGEAGTGKAAGRPLFIACPCCQGVASASCRVQGPLIAAHVPASRLDAPCSHDSIMQHTSAEREPFHAGVQGVRR